jgi:hypothetical protein
MDLHNPFSDKLIIPHTLILWCKLLRHLIVSNSQPMPTLHKMPKRLIQIKQLLEICTNW